MPDRKHYRTKCIGVRVRECDFGQLQALADDEDKSLGEWCREILLERGPSKKSLGVILVLAMAVVNTGAIVFYQYERDWPFPQQIYLKPISRHSVPVFVPDPPEKIA